METDGLYKDDTRMGGLIRLVSSFFSRKQTEDTSISDSRSESKQENLSRSWSQEACADLSRISLSLKKDEDELSAFSKKLLSHGMSLEGFEKEKITEILDTLMRMQEVVEDVIGGGHRQSLVKGKELAVGSDDEDDDACHVVLSSRLKMFSYAMKEYASLTTDRDKMMYMVDDIDGLITDAKRILQEKYNDVNDQPIDYMTPSADEGGLAKIAYKDLLTANEELKEILDTRKKSNTEVYSDELLVKALQIFRQMRSIGLRVLKELHQYARDDSPNDGNKENETAAKDIVRDGELETGLTQLSGKRKKTEVLGTEILPGSETDGELDRGKRRKPTEEREENSADDRSL